MGSLVEERPLHGKTVHFRILTFELSLVKFASPFETLVSPQDQYHLHLFHFHHSTVPSLSCWDDLNPPTNQYGLMWTIIIQYYTCLISFEMSPCDWYKGLIKKVINCGEFKGILLTAVGVPPCKSTSVPSKSGTVINANSRCELMFTFEKRFLPWSEIEYLGRCWRGFRAWFVVCSRHSAIIQHVFSNVRFASFLFISEHLMLCIYYLWTNYVIGMIHLPDIINCNIWIVSLSVYLN